jgi:hypothetical protein
VPRKDPLSVASKHSRKVCIVLGILWFVAGFFDLTDILTRSVTFGNPWRLALHWVPCLIFFMCGVVYTLMGMGRKSD